MARIPEAELERLKREVAVERLVEAAGVDLKRAASPLVRPLEPGVPKPAQYAFDMPVAILVLAASPKLDLRRPLLRNKFTAEALMRWRPWV